MNKNIGKLGYGIAALAVAGFAMGAVWASNTESIPFTPKIVIGTGCPGSYIGYVTMTNSTGGIWVTPVTNTTGSTFTNTSAFICNMYVIDRNSGVNWCGTNSVAFPASGAASYELTAFVKSPAPTNGQMITVQINW